MGREELEKMDLETPSERTAINPNLLMVYLAGNLCYNNSKHEIAKARAAKLNIARAQIELDYLRF